MTRKLSIPVLILAVLIASRGPGRPRRPDPHRRQSQGARVRGPRRRDGPEGRAFPSDRADPAERPVRRLRRPAPSSRTRSTRPSASGGLWKTVNNGQTFESIFENEKVFSIGDIAVAPSNPNIVWVGSGEANNSRSTYWGDGIYKSVDAGKTWKNMGLKESHHIGRIVIHPTNPDVVYVAALGHLYSENPERGLYKTTDGGKTWTKSLDVVVEDASVGVVDVVMDPYNPDVLYAATYDKFRKPWNFQLGGTGSGIHKTVDGGVTGRSSAAAFPAGSSAGSA